MPTGLRSSFAARVAALTLAIGTTLVAGARLQSPQDYVDRGEAAFAAGRLEDAVGAFDRLIALDSAAAPWIWQRGIALYYLREYEACAEQFAGYKHVNPADLESAVWHVACLARLRTVEEARGAMLPPGRDPRVMRAEVYEMFAGRLSPAAVVGRAGLIGDVALFYAHFYGGLYAEVLGDDEAAAVHLRAAASERFAPFGGFMNVVARHHWALINDRVGRESTRSSPMTRRMQ